PAALLDSDDADKRVGRIDQIESHSVHSPMDGGPLSVLLVLAVGAVDGMPQSLLTGRTPA
ncbi:MAG: hypothetical protein JRJ39_08010, partial [Deltaproteobacteria bacterium]|nr:hypothetical protein [Deltaproteobacteria bacterium]